MRVAAKANGHRLCFFLLQQAPYMKITKRNNEKKTKNYMNALNLHKICSFFHQTMGTNHFL